MLITLLSHINTFQSFTHDYLTFHLYSIIMHIYGAEFSVSMHIYSMYVDQIGVPSMSIHLLFLHGKDIKNPVIYFFMKYRLTLMCIGHQNL